MTTTIRARLGDRITELRRQRGWTQEDLAASTGLSTRSISNIENGVFSVTLDTLDKLAKGLKVKLPSLLDL